MDEPEFLPNELVKTGVLLKNRKLNITTCQPDLANFNM
jgi:hypothetical protein